MTRCRVASAGVRAALCFIAVALPMVAHANDQEPARLTNSLFFAGSSGVELFGTSDTPDPLSGLTIPHAFADTRETLVSVSGGAASEVDSAGGALGLIFPSRRIVWNGSVGVAGDQRSTLGRASFGLARPVGPRLAVGTSLGVNFSESAGDASVGIGVDVGTRYRLGAIGDVSRIELHAAMQRIGSSITGEDQKSFYPPFTPMVALRGRVLEREALRITGVAGLRAESFSRLSADLGVALRLSNGISATLGFSGSISDRNALWPGLSVGFAFRAPDTETLQGSVLAQPIRGGGVLAAGDVVTGFPSADQQAPQLTAQIVEPAVSGYRTTAAGGTVPRNATVGLAPVAGREQIVVDVSSIDDRAIADITARLAGSDGDVVRSWAVQPLGEPTIGGDLAARLTSELSHRELTSTLVWDIGSDTPEGSYRLVIESTDTAGNRAVVPDVPITVDRSPPDIDLTVERLAGGRSSDAVDGTQTNVLLEPDTSIQLVIEYDDAERIDATVVDQAGRTVRAVELIPDIEAPRNRLLGEWVGDDDAGNPMPEGVYRIRVRAGDEYGNAAVVTGKPVLVRRRDPVFRLGLSGTIVSPNGDGVRDAIFLVPELEPLPGLVQWELFLFSEDETAPRRRWSGIDLPPERIALDDTVLNADGRYFVAGVSRYEDGGEARDQTEPFRVDRRPPDVNLGLSRVVVTPESERRLTLFLEGDTTAVESRLILSGDNVPEPFIVERFDGLPEQADWRLVTPAGDLIEPGVYELRVEAEDAAGNVARSPARSFELVPRLEGAEIVAQDVVFSPNGDGRRDETAFVLRGPVDAASGSFEVRIASEDVVRRFSGSLPLPERITWDGRNNDGVPVSDGRYTAQLTVSVESRGEVTARSGSLRVDTQPPIVALDIVGPAIVSPDNDGRQDALTIELSAEGISFGALEALDRDRRVVASRSFERQENLGATVEWEPMSDEGAVLPDGEYSLRLRAADEAGNESLTDALSFTVDTRPVGGFLRLTRGAISPNGDGILDKVSIEPVIPDTAGLQNWNLWIEPVASSRRVYERSGTNADPPAEVTWPEDQELADGVYVVRLRGEYEHGPVLDLRSPRILVDTRAPEIAVRVSPQPFSPDGDGREDTVTVEMSIDDASQIEYWIMEVFDPTGRFFYDIGGREMPPRRFRWDGRARNGERVVSAEDYPWRLEVADALGNTRVVEGAFSIDVLVERFEDGFRIQIPSITFPPNSPELILDSDDPRGRRNRMVLDRLVEILGRFSEYSIVVEGHAVNLTGTEREEREELQPLSQARAESVRDALIARGVAARLLSAAGRGGTRPIVPHSDREERWKNRRVDFILRR